MCDFHMYEAVKFIYMVKCWRAYSDSVVFPRDKHEQQCLCRLRCAFKNGSSTVCLFHSVQVNYRKYLKVDVTCVMATRIGILLFSFVVVQLHRWKAFPVSSDMRFNLTISFFILHPITHDKRGYRAEARTDCDQHSLAAAALTCWPLVEVLLSVWLFK